jgi:hypothetical protein
MDQLRHAHLFPSFKALDGALQQQAGVLSYIDTFWILALVSAVCIPLTFLLQRIKLGGEPAGH